MNRTFVLETIRSTLAQLERQQQADQPLGEVVPLVALRLRSETNATAVETQVVPFNVVAAFVDGQATPEEEMAVCAAIQIDNSVLAELIAAVRAEMRSTDEPELSMALTDRLLALKPSLIAPSIKPTPSPINSNDEKVISPQRLGVNNQATVSKPGRWSTLLALAASIVLLIVAWGIWSRSRPKGNDTEVVQQSPQLSPQFPDDSSVMPKIVPDENREIVQVPVPESIKHIEEPRELPRVANDGSSKGSVPQVVAPLPDLPLAPDKGNQYAAQDATSVQTDWTNVKWSRVQGLLARQEAMSTKPDSESPRYGKWMGAVEDTALAPPRARMRWRTFPGSHAQASLASGGRLVLQADTEIELQESTQHPSSFALQHGAFAFVDLPKGTDVQIHYAGHPVRVQWKSKATMVFLGSSQGLQAQVSGGQITIDGKSYRNVTVIVQPDAVSEINAPRQLPAWINRPPESTLSRSVLQKLSRSQDIEATLGELVATGRGLDEPARSQFQLWLSTLNQDVLYNVLFSGGAPVRSVAFRRALTMPMWSDTWQEFWRKLESTLQDAEKLRVLKASVLLAQNGVRPNLDQASRLVACLDSPDRAARSLSDLLLRQLVGSGPVFDPDSQGAANTRQIGLWRRYINAQQLR